MEINYVVYYIVCYNRTTGSGHSGQDLGRFCQFLIFSTQVVNLAVQII